MQMIYEMDLRESWGSLFLSLGARRNMGRLGLGREYSTVDLFLHDEIHMCAPAGMELGIGTQSRGLCGLDSSSPHPLSCYSSTRGFGTMTALAEYLPTFSNQHGDLDAVCRRKMSLGASLTNPLPIGIHESSWLQRSSGCKVS